MRCQNRSEFLLHAVESHTISYFGRWEKKDKDRNLNSCPIFACNLYIRVYTKRVVKYFVKNDKNGRWFSFTVEFVQLSRGIQVASGESVLLRCLVNKPVVQCEWSWKASNSSQEPLLVKKFNPNKDADHDCSVRFKNILYEEEGLWTCGVRLSPDGILHEAPPATVSLLPTGINWEDGKKFVSNLSLLHCSSSNISWKMKKKKIKKLNRSLDSSCSLFQPKLTSLKCRRTLPYRLVRKPC